MIGRIEKHGVGYRIRVTIGYNEKGNPIRVQKKAKAKDRRLVEKELAEFITELEAGEYIKPEKMYFRNFVKEWEQKYAEDGLSATTFETHQQFIKSRILPALGHRRMIKLRHYIF